MTGNGHDHDELLRRLADEGRASAPPDLAPEVVRRVRAEPRHRERRILRPVATLLAAMSREPSSFHARAGRARPITQDDPTCSLCQRCRKTYGALRRMRTLSSNAAR